MGFSTPTPSIYFSLPHSLPQSLISLSVLCIYSWFWRNASEQISRDRGEGGRGGRGKKKQSMCQLCASMVSWAKDAKARVLFIGANRRSYDAAGRWVISALGVSSTVDPRRARVTSMPPSIPRSLSFIFVILIIACIANASHSLSSISSLSVCIFYASLPFLWHLECVDSQSRACQS